MPVLTFAPGTTQSFDFIISSIDTLTSTAQPTGVSTTLITFLAGGTEYVVRGTNFGFTQVGSDVYLSSGVIEEIDILVGGNLVLSITDMGLDAFDLFNAVIAEQTPAGIGALENLLNGLDYTYHGLAGRDVLRANATSGDGVAINMRGDDNVFLYGGRDNFFLGDGNDTANAGGGNDTVFGGSGNDSITGFTGDDVLGGGSGNDTLLGHDGYDLLKGEGGADLLRGGADEDTLQGGTGRDTLFGEGGADRFLFATGAEMGTVAARDIIRDFDSGSDVIDLTGLGLGAFRGTAGFSGTQAEARFVTAGGHGYLNVDIDGNKTVDFSVQLIGITALVAGDVVI